jgi:murein DD-endopeptidase MepM/ murein hydrolase activator NlpD
MRLLIAIGVSCAIASVAGAQDAGASAAVSGSTTVGGITVPAGVTRAISWAAGHGRECHRYHARRMCEGPRRVPAPSAEDEARAHALAIAPGAARRVLVERPRQAWIAAAGAPAADLAWPVDGGRVWRGFGMLAGIVVGRGGHLGHTGRRHPHEGVDIGAPAGTPILAANEGLVVYSDNGMTGYGNALLIVHGDASVTLYGHCTATFVVAGQHVARGEVIASVGDTGLAHGAHLHFELHVDGQPVDPLPRFAARPDVPAPAASPGEAAPDDDVEVDVP